MLAAAAHSHAETVSPLPFLSGSDKPVVEGALLLDTLIDDDSITEIMINRHNRIYIERNGRLQDAGVQLASPGATDALADALIARCGKDNMQQARCIVDGMLPDGARVNIVLAPVAVDGASISIRKFPKKPITLPCLVAGGFMTAEMSHFLQMAVRARVNILVSGNTSSGKTTLLNALSAAIGPQERIIAIEDTPELQLQHHNVVRLGTKGGLFTQNEDDITLRHLVKNSLRMRPDRLIIGEVRGEEALDLMHALNTGHSGCMSTLHANSPRETLTRLTHMIHLANTGLPSKYIQSHIPQSFELIVQTHRDEAGMRRVTHITEVVGIEGENFVLQHLFDYRHDAHADGWAYHVNPALPRNEKLRQLLLRQRLDIAQAKRQ